MAGGVITAGLLGLGGSLLGAVGESQSQKAALRLQMAMAEQQELNRRQERYKDLAEKTAFSTNQIFLAPEADITRQLAASKYKFGQGFDLEQAAESSAKARQATESMSPLQQSFANLLIQKNAEKERLGDSENNKLAAMFGPIGSGAALAGKYGLFGGGGAY
jgi:hypothetical protein